MKKLFFALLCVLAAQPGQSQEEVVMTVAGEPVYRSEYDYNYNNGTSDEHQFAGKQWWLDAFNTGLVIDRTEMQKLLAK